MQLVLLALLAVLISGCQNSAQAEISADALSAQAGAAPPTPTLAPTATQPVVVFTVSAAQPESMPAFALADPDELTRAAPTATPEPAAATEAGGETAVSLTDTPQPTFTPPALPLTSADEHYWFRRPIPEGGTVWTDKVYPYGSTRGGTLPTHHGVEFYVPSGTQILAVASGLVVTAGSDAATVFGPNANFYGNVVVIQHDTPLDGQLVYSLYGHLSEIYVTEGQRVESQQIIALSGATGVADGPHLHFEVRVGANSYDNTRNPLLWLYPFPDRGTVVGRVTFPDGGLAYQAPVSLNRVDAPSRYLATTTYADDSVNADPAWNENFAIDDVDAGYYEVIVTAGEKKYKAEVWVYPYRTSFVEIVIGGE